MTEEGWTIWATENDIGFKVKRAFWLTDIPDGQWRGRHAHRESVLATFAIAGRCQMHLDDGTAKQTVTLEGPTRGLIIGNWVWHELTDFASDTVVLVLASTAYDEAEYLRGYDIFLAGAQVHNLT